MAHLSVVASDLNDKQANTAAEVLIECLGSDEDNVELIEQICFALNAYVTTNGMKCYFFYSTNRASNFAQIQKWK